MVEVLDNFKRLKRVVDTPDYARNAVRDWVEWVKLDGKLLFVGYIEKVSEKLAYLTILVIRIWSIN